MNQTLSVMGTNEQDRRISEAVGRERDRLRNFIRRRVPDESDAEDILQDVLYELVAAFRVMQPIEQVSAWLFRVARNRITDLFRRRRPAAEPPDLFDDDGDTMLSWEEFLPSPDAGPEAAYVRSVLLDELETALQELPAAQREVFIAHEIEGHTFKELASETGVNLSTLLARKRYAVLYLRQRLRDIYNEFSGASSAGVEE